MSSAPARTGTAGASQGAGDVKAVRAQLELMEQDCARVSAPDYMTPFQSLEDAVDRLLPFHMFGAEDPLQTDVREMEAATAPSRLATTRHEAWQDLTMHKVNEFCAALISVEKRVQRADQERLEKSEMPLYMLQSYATAEANAITATEKNRKGEEERKAAQKAAAEQRAIQEAQRAAAAKAEAEAIAKQQQQQALMAQRQHLLMQQQQQAMAAIQQQQQQQQQAAQAQAAAQAQQRVGAALGQQQQLQQQQQLPGTSQQLGMQPGLLAHQAPGGMPAQQSGPAQMAGQAPLAGAKPGMTAAQQKAAQLAALKARISQRK